MNLSQPRMNTIIGMIDFLTTNLRDLKSGLIDVKMENKLALWAASGLIVTVLYESLNACLETFSNSEHKNAHEDILTIKNKINAFIDSRLLEK